MNPYRVSAIINAAILSGVPAGAKALLEQALEELATPDLPSGVEVIGDEDPVNKGRYRYKPDGAIRVTLEEMKDYVLRLAEREANLAHGPQWSDVYDGLKDNVPPGETPL